MKQIKAVPQPVADTAKLAKWIGLLEEEQKLLGEIGRRPEGREEDAGEQPLRPCSTHNGNLANNAVLGFEFNYCLIDSSRFS